MRRKVMTYFMILVVIGISVTGFFISQLARKLYKQEVEERLASAASLIIYQIRSGITAGVPVDYDIAAKNYAKLLDRPKTEGYHQTRMISRVTFINYSGDVIGDSEADIKSMENHLNRKEIQEAIKGFTGKNIRLSRTLGIEYYYIAVPLETGRVILRISIPLLRLKKIDEIIFYYTAAGILAGLLLTLLLAFRFSKQLTKPISQLISASRELSMGNYSKRVNIKTKDELGELAGSFNEMALRLEQTVADLKDKNLKLDSIINSMADPLIAVDRSMKIILVNDSAYRFFSAGTAKDMLGAHVIELVRNHRIHALLQKTFTENSPLVDEIVLTPPEDKILRIYITPIRPKDSSAAGSGAILFIQDVTNIRKLEQIRTEFVSNVTHELKTPLTSIRGFVETLRSGAVHDAEVEGKFLEIIDIEAERLHILINDILQLSEIESGQGCSGTSRYRLKPVLEEVLSMLEGSAAKKSVSLQYEADEEVSVEANRDRIKQMLINLVDNAVKYNVEKGSVRVRAFRADGKAIISVKDTGIGIPAGHLPRIFERFYRVDKGRSRSMGGTGLGLSIVKHIVNLYNGDIKVYSEPGKGTEFIIQLPS